MTDTSKTGKKQARSSDTDQPESARCRAMNSIYDTVREYELRQGTLNAAWRFDNGSVSSFQSVGVPPSQQPSLPPIEYFPSSGFLDISFGNRGFGTTTPGTNDEINSVAIISTGKIIAGCGATVRGNSVFCLTRYNSNGSLDTTFATNGYNITTPGISDAIKSIAIIPSGQIIAGGYATVSGKMCFCVARYNSDGSLDRTFAINGFNTTSPGIGDGISSIAITSSGQIIAGGFTMIGGGLNFCLARYNSNGSLDTTFANNGFNIITPGIEDGINSIDLTPSGQIIAGGYADMSGIPVFCLARYNVDGSIDTTFATNGFNTTTPGTNDGINAVRVASTGQIIAGGGVHINGVHSCCIARYNSDGSLDTTFVNNGYNMTTPGTDDSIYTIAITPLGRILAGGYATISGMNLLSIARYNSDGSLDTNFGINGFNNGSPSINDCFMSLAIQPDGEVIAGGFATIGNNQGFLIARYL